MPTTLVFALPEIWPVIAGALILWAIVYIFQKPISFILGLIPAIGRDLADAFGRGLERVLTWARDWLAEMAEPLVALVSAPVYWFVGIVRGAVLTVEAIYQAIVTLAQELASISSYVLNRLVAVASTVAALAAQVPRLAERVADLAGDVARFLTVTIPAAIATAVARAVAAAQALISQAVAALQRGIDAVRSWAQAQVRNLELGLEALRAATAAAIAAAVAVATLPLQVGLGNLADALKGLQLRVDGQLGQITQALAALLALDLVRVIPQVIEEVTTMRRNCVDPTCGVIGPQLATLQSLLQGVEIALLLAWVTDAVNDPNGSARQTAGDAGGLQVGLGEILSFRG